MVSYQQNCPPLRGARVLVVEDNALVALLLEDELSDAGAMVVGPAASAAEALLLIDATADVGGLSAATLDGDLDEETALPVADRLAALGVPFVFTTGYGDARDMGGHGAAPVLLKPFDPATLINLIARLTTPERRRL